MQLRVCDWAKTPLSTDDKVFSLKLGEETFEVSQDSYEILLQHLKSATVTQPSIQPQNTPTGRPSHIGITLAQAEQVLAESQIQPPLSALPLSDSKSRRKAQEQLDALNGILYDKYKTTNTKVTRGLSIGIDYKGENK